MRGFRLYLKSVFSKFLLRLVSGYPDLRQISQILERYRGNVLNYVKEDGRFFFFKTGRFRRRGEGLLGFEISLCMLSLYKHGFLISILFTPTKTR